MLIGLSPEVPACVGMASGGGVSRMAWELVAERGIGFLNMRDSFSLLGAWGDPRVIGFTLCLGVFQAMVFFLLLFRLE